MKSFAKFAVAAAAILSFGAHAGVTIDNFNTGDQTVVDGPAIDGAGVWHQVSGSSTDIIGGYRDIFAMKTAGGSGSTKTVSGEVAGGNYSFNSASGTSGFGIIRWDGATAGSSSTAGPDGTFGIVKNGFAGVDLASSSVAFKVTVLSADLGFPFTLQVFSGDNWSEITLLSNTLGTFNIPFAAFFGPNDADFTDGFTRTVHGAGVNFFDVTAMQAIINPGSSVEAVDLTIDLAETVQVPEPGSLALVGLALIGVGAARRAVAKKKA